MSNLRETHLITQQPWTDERVAQLKSLWADGLSASQIAQQLGGVSRNAVIGKIHRLGSTDRPASKRVNRPRRSSAPTFRAAPPSKIVFPVVEEEPLKLDDGTLVTTLMLSSRMCRWPIGDPRTDAFHFCGRLPKESSAYCEAHHRRAHRPRDAHPKSAEVA